MIEARVNVSIWPYRQPGADHSLAMRVYADPIAPLFHGPDFAIAADIDFAALGEIPRRGLIGWEDEQGDDVAFFSAQHARIIAGDDDDLQRWINWVLSCIVAPTPTRLHPVPSGPSRTRAVVDLVDVRAETFTVARAARILTRDPLIDIGRDNLLTRMREWGWITKDHDAFVPTPSAEAGGWLARNQIWNHGSKIAFNQVRIRREGIREIQRRLGGVTVLDLDAAPTPLVEV